MSKGGCRVVRCESVRVLISLAKEGDENAFSSLANLFRGDIQRVVARVLDNRTFIDQVVCDVIVRLFVYLPRFEVRPGVNDTTATEHLRRWTTNLARNWARTVNRYGVVDADRWLIPLRLQGKPYRRKRNLSTQVVSLDSQYPELLGSYRSEE